MNPTLIVGPMLQSRMNTSAQVIMDFFDGRRTVIPKGFITLVDVRDVALAHLRALERPQAQGRYLLIGGCDRWADLVPTMASAGGERFARVGRKEGALCW